ncbi:MAG: hypothetical protein RR795_02735 [Cetobacterium sp.]|uniref:hypothetical protein n=1 Tax=Cetobacterium sp. TaxID=2071632 RepID=UPI002FC6CA23
MNLEKIMKVSWRINELQFERGVFLEGDLNIAILDIQIENFTPDSELELSFYNENEKKLYVQKEVNLQQNIKIKIPNEVLQVPGQVFVRLTQKKGDSILQATEEIYFYVVKKKIMNS